MSEFDVNLVEDMSYEILTGMNGLNPEYGVELLYRYYKLLPDTLSNAITFSEILEELMDEQNQAIISHIKRVINRTSAVNWENVEHLAVSVLIRVITDFKLPVNRGSLVRAMIPMING